MIFSYDENAGEKNIKITGNSFIHLFKSRRTEPEAKLSFRNLKDNFNYIYKIEELKKKEAILSLVKKEKIKVRKTKKLHLG
jgi:16S rRNA (uracil1498-N3)-methyltransferase